MNTTPQVARRRVAIVGAGHVGVVYAAGLAKLGHTVSVIDVDRARVATLKRGRSWFSEPELDALLAEGVERGRIIPTLSYRKGLDGVEFTFVCVPTPSGRGGRLDQRHLRSAFTSIRDNVGQPPPIVVNKSTVPVGTSGIAADLFAGTGIRLVSSPEFLAQGRAVHGFFHPHRIVIGSEDRNAADAVASLFVAIPAPFVFTDSTTAELGKLGSNAFLALKVSFANALAALAEGVGADADGVAQVMALDPRIGSGHLAAGLGFGGSCLPKDVAAVAQLARSVGAYPALFDSILPVNEAQPARLTAIASRRLKGLRGRKIAVLGLTYKAGTDDTRHSPAIGLVTRFLRAGATVVAYDPAAQLTPIPGARRVSSTTAAARGADAIVIATDWPEFAQLDLARLRAATRGDLLIDGRHMIEPQAARAAGFDYYAVGRR